MHESEAWEKGFAHGVEALDLRVTFYVFPLSPCKMFIRPRALFAVIREVRVPPSFFVEHRDLRLRRRPAAWSNGILLPTFAARSVQSRAHAKSLCFTSQCLSLSLPRDFG